MNFQDARHLARMSREEVQEYLELSKSTIKRYEKTGKAPKSVIECLLMISGKCPTFSMRNDFSGWSFGQGFIWTPEGDKFTSGDVRAGKHALLETNRLYRQHCRERQEKKKLAIKGSAQIIQFPLKREKINISA